jgi:hypothetical protein
VTRREAAGLTSARPPSVRTSRVSRGRDRTPAHAGRHRRAGLVRAAERAWAVSEYRTATQASYYAKWDIDRKNLVGSAC